MRQGMGLSLYVILAILSGCTTDATSELTSAPFDATTDVTDSVTAASSEFTDPLTEFTSSTTPGSWFTGDNPAKARQKVKVFIAYSLENLRSDIAQGHGEYLISLATLVGVPADRRADFQVQLKNSYATMFEETLSPRESSVRLFTTAWSMGMGGEKAQDHGNPYRLSMVDAQSINNRNNSNGAENPKGSK